VLRDACLSFQQEAMNILHELKSRFHSAVAPLIDDTQAVLDMIRPAQDARFGDYQANGAMALGKQLGCPPREVAQQIVAHLNVDDLCLPPEVAGPGFINLRLRDTWLANQLLQLQQDERLGVPLTDQPHTYIVDFSSPNVAKPMHVGHIRSTVIGDALCRVLRFLGHRVISDNHLGDWGTQFGMIIYGYRQFVDHQAYDQEPVQELGRVYRIVRQIMDYYEALEQLPRGEQRLRQLQELAAQAHQQSAQHPKDKKLLKAADRLGGQVADAEQQLRALQAKLQATQHDPQQADLVARHADIHQAVLRETSKLHAGDGREPAAVAGVLA
jgi:arginyl-tRNA synthetase